jgi:hypothetical protein
MVATTIHPPQVPAIVITAGRGVVGAARFLGHFLLALVGVIFLGNGLDH